MAWFLLNFNKYIYTCIKVKLISKLEILLVIQDAFSIHFDSFFIFLSSTQIYKSISPIYSMMIWALHVEVKCA